MKNINKYKYHCFSKANYQTPLLKCFAKRKNLHVIKIIYTASTLLPMNMVIRSELRSTMYIHMGIAHFTHKQQTIVVGDMWLKMNTSEMCKIKRIYLCGGTKVKCIGFVKIVNIKCISLP